MSESSTSWPDLIKEAWKHAKRFLCDFRHESMEMEYKSYKVKVVGSKETVRDISLKSFDFAKEERFAQGNIKGSNNTQPKESESRKNAIREWTTKRILKKKAKKVSTSVITPILLVLPNRPAQTPLPKQSSSFILTESLNSASAEVLPFAPYFPPIRPSAYRSSYEYPFPLTAPSSLLNIRIAPSYWWNVACIYHCTRLNEV